MRLVALDLSMTSTGVAVVDDTRPPDSWPHLTIKTGSRRKGEREIVCDLRRYDIFKRAIATLLASVRPQLVAVEVTSHSHGFGGGKRTTKGGEYRAGLFLGQAKGWLHGALDLAKAYGIDTPDVDLLESSEVKRRITGNHAASKDAVRARLEEQLACSLTTWTPDEVDALAVATTALRARESGTPDPIPASSVRAPSNSARSPSGSRRATPRRRRSRRSSRRRTRPAAATG